MSVFLGNFVRAALYGGTEVTRLVKQRIYPVIATQGTPGYPFITFKAEISGVQYAKGLTGLTRVEDLCAVAVRCMSKSYDEALSLASKVRGVLECASGDFEGFHLDPMELTSGDCWYDEALTAYVYELTFQTNTQPSDVEGDDDDV